MMSETVKVTQEHINAGSAINCTKCPVALAINEAMSKYKEYSYASVSPSCVRLVFNSDGDQISTHWDTPTPQPVRQFITEFDRGDTVEPFEFELALV